MFLLSPTVHVTVFLLWPTVHVTVFLLCCTEHVTVFLLSYRTCNCVLVVFYRTCNCVLVVSYRTCNCVLVVSCSTCNCVLVVSCSTHNCVLVVSYSAGNCVPVVMYSKCNCVLVVSCRTCNCVLVVKMLALMALVKSDVIINQETLSTQCVKIVCADCWSHFGDISTVTEVMNLISSAIILHFILHVHGRARTWSLVTGVTVCLCVGFKSCVARHTWCCGGTPTSSSPSSPWCCSVASPSFSPWMTSATSARPWPWRKRKRRPWPIFWNSSATPMVIPGPLRWTGFSTICHTSAVASEPVGRSWRLWTKWTCHQCGREGWGAQSPFRDDIFSPMSVFAPVVRGVSSGALVCSLPLLSKGTFTWNSH